MFNNEHAAKIVDNFQPNKLKWDYFQQMSAILSRIQEISVNEGITIGAIERSIGASKGVLSRAISNGTDIQSKWIQKIVENYPQYSSDWLLTGEGHMLKSIQVAQPYQPVPLSDNVCLNESTPTVSYSPNKGAPYYDVDFLGGFELTFNNQTINPEYNIDFKPFNKKGVSWVNITGHSMEPKINHGDIIALKECRLEDVQYGEIYAVVLDTLRTVKILRKSKAPNKMRYVPINKEDYDEQEYDNSRILHIFEVLGNISRFM